MAKSAAERKKEERDRYREKGLVQLIVWINPDDKERITQYIKGLHP